MTTPADTSALRDAREQSARGSPVWFAERVLLGALLHDPSRIEQVAGWLTAQDFCDPQHSALFATMLGLHVTGELGLVRDSQRHAGFTVQYANAHNVNLVCEAVRAGRFAPAGADVRAVVAEAYQVGAVVSDSQVARYGQMTLEMSARRQVGVWAVALEAAASPEMTVDNEGTALQNTHAAVLDNLADLDAQARRSLGQGVGPWDRSSSPVPAAGPVMPLPAPLLQTYQRRVIQAVICDDPTWREAGLTQRLRPEDFVGSPAHASTWRVVQDLVCRNEPVDPITVAWHLQAASAAEDGPVGLPVADLVDMRRAPDGDVARAVSTVARAALAEHARIARVEVQSAANDRSTPLADVMGSARDAADRLDHHARRLGIGPSRLGPSTISRTLAGESAIPTPSQPSPARSRVR